MISQFVLERLEPERPSMPLARRVFHGSPRSGLRRVLTSPASRQFDNGTSQLGAFFAASRESAAPYAGPSGKVYEIDLRLRRPFEMPWSVFNYLQDPTKDAERRDLPSSAWGSRLAELGREGLAIRNELERQGYDGMIVRNGRGDILEISSFSDVEFGAAPNPPSRRRNSDEELQALRRKAETGDPSDKVRFAAARARAGEDVAPWELEATSYLLLDAYRRGARVEARTRAGNLEKFYVSVGHFRGSISDASVTLDHMNRLRSAREHGEIVFREYEPDHDGHDDRCFRCYAMSLVKLVRATAPRPRDDQGRLCYPLPKEGGRLLPSDFTDVRLMTWSPGKKPGSKGSWRNNPYWSNRGRRHA